MQHEYGVLSALECTSLAHRTRCTTLRGFEDSSTISTRRRGRSFILVFFGLQVPKMSLSNTVLFVVSRHRAGSDFDYRVHMADGTMRIMTESQVRCCVSGDQSLADFDPAEEFEARPPPTSAREGPQVNDIIRVQVRNEWIVGTVVETKLGGIYRVMYDDGMCVQDRLSLPWAYVAVAAPAASSMPSLKIRVRLLESAPQPTMSQMSTKALGKRRMGEGGDPAQVMPGPTVAQPAETTPRFDHKDVADFGQKVAHALPEDRAPSPAMSKVAELTDYQTQLVLKNDSMYLARYDAMLDCL